MSDTPVKENDESVELRQPSPTHNAKKEKKVAKMKSATEMKLLQDLRFSKSKYNPWGRQIIRAMDSDDCLQLVNTYETHAQLGADVNFQVTDNYGGHVWTPYIHNFVGDTALHMALRQGKLKCAYMLLALGARSDLENHRKETPADIMHHKYNKTPRQMQLDAFREVIPLLPAENLQQLPKRSHPSITHVNWKTIEREAWDMMLSGRNFYVELPETLMFNDLDPDPKPPKKERARKWAVRFDNARKQKYRVDLLTGEVEWLGTHPAKQEGEERVPVKPPTVEDKWTLCIDEHGKKYYLNQGTGQTQTEMPDAFKSKSTLEKEANERKLKALNETREKQGLEPLTELPVAKDDEDYDYKAAGDSDSEDERQAMEVLRQKRLKEIEMEEFAKNKAQREAEEARQAAIRARLVANREKRKLMQAETFLTGIDTSIGAINTGGDVWGRNRYSDVVRMLKKQMDRQQRMTRAEQHRQSGLTLLAAAANNRKPGISTQLLKGIQDLEGIKKLSFAKYQRLRQLAQEIAEPPDRAEDLELPIRFISCLSSRTNLKGMIVSNRGAKAIAAVLVGDYVMKSMNFHACGISRLGCEALAKTLVTMRALTNLNLSCNAVDCDGAIALAAALANNNCPLLRLSLAGNRIRIRGARTVVSASVSPGSKLLYLSITNNFIRPHEREELAQICGYSYANKGQQRFVKKDEFAGPSPGIIYRWPFAWNPFSDDRHSWPPRSEWKPVEIRERDARREQAKKDALADPARAVLEINHMIKHDKYAYEPLELSDGDGRVPLLDLGRRVALIGAPKKLPPKEKILKESPRRTAEEYRAMERGGSRREEVENEEEEDINIYQTPTKGPWKIAMSSPSNKRVTFSATKYSTLREQDLLEVGDAGEGYADAAGPTDRGAEMQIYL